MAHAISQTSATAASASPADLRHVADDVGLQVHHVPRRLVVLVRALPERKDALVDRAQLRPCGRRRRSRPQPRDDREREGTAPRRRRELLDGEPLLPLLERSDRPGQNARQRVVRSVEPHGLSDGVRASAQALLPERVAHDDRRSARRLPVRLGESAPEGRLNSEDVEVGPRHHPSRHHVRRLAVAERERAARVRGDLLELRLLRRERQVVGGREPEDERRRVRVDPHEPPGIRVRQGLEQGRVDRAEDRGRRADAEADRQDDHQRQHGRPQQAPDRDARVLREVLEHEGQLHAVLPSFVLAAAVRARLLDVPELAKRLAPRVLDRHAGRGQLLDAHLEMHAQLVVDLRRHRLGLAAEIPERPRPAPLPHQPPWSTASTARE